MKLSPKEKIAIGAGAVVLFALFAYKGSDYWDTYKNSQRRVAAARSNLERAKQWSREIQAERTTQKAIENQIDPRFNLYTFASNNLRNRGLSTRAQIQNTRSLASASDRLAEVKITLNGVSMEELVNFLYDLYSSENLIILKQMDYLRVSRSGKGLDCSMAFLAPTA